MCKVAKVLLLSSLVLVCVCSTASATVVAKYTFNEGYGAVAYDSSGNERNGDISGAAHGIVTRGNYALVLDGSDDWVDFGDANLLPSVWPGATGQTVKGFTIEAWVRIDDVNQEEAIILAGGDDRYSGHRKHGLLYGDGHFIVSVEGYTAWGTSYNRLLSDTGTNAVTINSGQWYHVVATFEGDNGGDYIKLYIDGKQIGSMDSPGYVKNSMDWTTGKPNTWAYYYSPSSPGGSSDYFKGEIDELRLHTDGLTDAQVLSSYIAGPTVDANVSPKGGLIAHYPFNDPVSSTTVQNFASTGSYDGTIYGGAERVGFGKSNLALNFTPTSTGDGGGDYVNFGDLPLPDTVTTWSIEAWVYFRSGSYGNPVWIMGQEGSWSGLWGWWKFTGYAGSSSDEVIDSGTNSYGQWYHVVETHNSSAHHLYIDGNLVDTDSTTSSRNNSARLDWIAGMQDAIYVNEADAWLDGMIDDIKVYIVALNSDDVNINYAAGPTKSLNGVRLNTLVDEWVTYTGTDTNGVYSFRNPRDGWIYISNKGSDSVTITDDNNTDITVDLLYEYEDVPEAMVELPAGLYTISVTNVNDLIVRQIPELMWSEHDKGSTTDRALYPGNAFHRHEIYPHYNTLIWMTPTMSDPFLGQWLGSGRKWLHKTDVNNPYTTVSQTVDYITSTTGFSDANGYFSGTFFDEFEPTYESKFSLYGDAVEDIYEDPNYDDRMFYGYISGINSHSTGKPMLKKFVDVGAKVGIELYLGESETESAAATNITNKLIGFVDDAVDNVPDIDKHMLIVLGSFDEPGLTIDGYPNVNLRSFVDKQMYTIATDDTFEDIFGLLQWISNRTTPELTLWFARLFRHYGIEGKTNRLDASYYLYHLDDSDFKAGNSTYWTITQGGSNTVGFGDCGYFGWYVMGAWNGGNSDAIKMTRTASGANKFSQSMDNIDTSKTYSVSLYSVDNTPTVDFKHPLEITVSNATVSDFTTYQVTSEKPTSGTQYFNYHWAMFKPTSTGCTLTVSDWESPTSSGNVLGHIIWYDNIQVQPLYWLDHNVPPVAQWTFNENGSAGNTVAKETSGFNVEGYTSDANLIGGITWQTAPGTSNYCVRLDGTNDAITYGESLQIIPKIWLGLGAEGLSFEVWAKFDDITDNESIIVGGNRGTGFSPMHALIVGDSNIIAAFDGYTYLGTEYNRIKTGSSMTLANNTWYHIVATYEGQGADQKMILYVNGSQKASATSTGYFQNGGDWKGGIPNSNAYHGSGTSTQYFDGDIDEVRIYDYAMTASQVLSNYNNGPTEGL